ncbi:MAG TPA: MerR family transcriptional regulator [Gammaproteobacteria bacterium]|nr:MerR family transcriptional regulator [Gammaproteobacteria bacterium]
MKTPKMTISRFARSAGVGVETVRYYQRCGLLPVPRTKMSGYREYDNSILQQLRFIQRAQLAGFTLKQIKQLIDFDPMFERHQIQEMTRNQIKALDAQIKQLQKISTALKGWLSDCEQAGHKVVCPIIKALGEEFTSDFGE